MRYQADIELLDQCSAGLFMSSLATCPRTNPLLVLHAFLLLCISNLHLPLEYMINSIYFYASNSERLIYASSHEKRLLPFQTGEFPSGGACLSQLIIEEASTPRQPKWSWNQLPVYTHSSSIIFPNVKSQIHQPAEWFFFFMIDIDIINLLPGILMSSFTFQFMFKIQWTENSIRQLRIWSICV